jgi:hypothetical protein
MAASRSPERTESIDCSNTTEAQAAMDAQGVMKASRGKDGT